VTTLLIRPNRNEVDREALQAFGIDTLIDPYLRIEPVDNPTGALRLVEKLREASPCWLIITSANALSYWLEQLPQGALEEVMASHPTIRYAAIGEHTATLLRERGIDKVLVPDLKNARSLAQLLVHTQPCPVVIPAGSISMRSLPETLVPAGFEVVEEVFYHTEPTPEPPKTAGRLKDYGIDSVLLRSPSAAQAFLAFNPTLDGKIPLICGGVTTAHRVRALGIEPDLVCVDPSPQVIAQETAQLLGKI